MSEKKLTERQSEAMERIKKNPLSLIRYTGNEQFYELCLEAVRRNGLALEYVENQTFEIC